MQSLRVGSKIRKPLQQVEDLWKFDDCKVEPRILLNDKERLLEWGNVFGCSGNFCNVTDKEQLGIKENDNETMTLMITNIYRKCIFTFCHMAIIFNR